MHREAHSKRRRTYCAYSTKWKADIGNILNIGNNAAKVHASICQYQATVARPQAMQ